MVYVPLWSDAQLVTGLAPYPTQTTLPARPSLVALSNKQTKNTNPSPFLFKTSYVPHRVFLPPQPLPLSSFLFDLSFPQDHLCSISSLLCA